MEINCWSQIIKDMDELKEENERLTRLNKKGSASWKEKVKTIWRLRDRITELEIEVELLNKKESS